MDKTICKNSKLGNQFQIIHIRFCKFLTETSNFTIVAGYQTNVYDSSRRRSTFQLLCPDIYCPKCNERLG
jgi:hypothetical protein